MALADIAVVGLAVMGRNLALNLAEKGFKVAIYNRTAERTHEAMAAAGDLASNFIPCMSLEEMVKSLVAPRVVLLMVKAGEAVDQAIEHLKPLLGAGDIIIDAGNANYRDSVRRGAALAPNGVEFLGVGVSGGEFGARHGPSIMIGGDTAASQRALPILTAIAARYDGEPCCAYVGPGGAGHFVKTMHNGIEYADMEMIAEIYGLLRDRFGLNPAAAADIFDKWLQGPLESYLIEITVQALRAFDPATGKPMVDVILDSAEQKGTGRWAVIEALDLGVSASAIAAAVEARGLSSARALRAKLASKFAAPAVQPEKLTRNAVDALEKALIAGKILSYTQGFAVMAAASKQFGWALPLDKIALIWRAGCIIRSILLDRIANAYKADADLASLLLDEGFARQIAESAPALQRVLSEAIAHGQAMPALGAAYAYLQQLRNPRSALNLIQAQRDIFGAHGFERTDMPGAHHGPWATII